MNYHNNLIFKTENFIAKNCKKNSFKKNRLKYI